MNSIVGNVFVDVSADQSVQIVNGNPLSNEECRKQIVVQFYLSIPFIPGKAAKSSLFLFIPKAGRSSRRPDQVGGVALQLTEEPPILIQIFLRCGQRLAIIQCAVVIPDSVVPVDLVDGTPRGEPESYIPHRVEGIRAVCIRPKDFSDIGKQLSDTVLIAEADGVA